MYCKNCGKELKASAKFCPACGTKVSNANPSKEEIIEETNDQEKSLKIPTKAIVIAAAVVIVVVAIIAIAVGTSRGSGGSTASSDSNGETIEEGGFTYSQLDGTTFHFTSGVGAWETWLVVNPDGSFYGSYHDSDMWDPEYEGGIVRLCDFTGEFESLTKIDEYTYKTRIKNIEYDKEPGTSETKLEEGLEVGYLYSDAYGLDDQGDTYIYLPGKPVSELPKGYIDWAYYELQVSFDSSELVDTLPFYGLYSESIEAGFYSENTASSEDYYETPSSEDGFIFYDSDVRLLTDADLAPIANDKRMLAIARNEMYARYGYEFTTNQEMIDYFSSKSWYYPSTTDQQMIYKNFSQIEKKNIDLIKEYESRL